MTLLSRYYRWWASDYQPLDGRLRAIAYLILLWISYTGLFDRTLMAMTQCPADLFQPPGLMYWFVHVTGLSQSDLYSILTAIKIPLAVLWVCAALGFLGRAPIFLTGLGVAFYVGCTKSCGGPGHTYDLTMYVLFVCGLLLTPDKWSLDFLISRVMPAWPFNPEKRTGTDLSGYARKLVLLLSVYTLFAGGIAKLWQGGLSWMDGTSMYYFVSSISEPKFSLGSQLAEFLLQYPSLLVVLSVWTILLELGIILTLFFPRLRWPFFLNAWLFHVGIYLILRPRYWPQMTCYLFFTHWEIFRHFNPKQIFLSLLGLKALPSAQPPSPLPRIAVQIWVAASSTLLCLFLILTIASQREWFPFTYIPMYSSYVSDRQVGRFQRSDFGNPTGLRHIALNTDNASVPWWSKFEVIRRAQLYGRQRGGEWTNMSSRFPDLVVDRFLWMPRLRDAVLDDMRLSMPEVGDTLQMPKTQIVLNSVRDRVLERSEWKQFDEIALILKSDDGQSWTLATISRNPPPSQ